MGNIDAGAENAEKTVRAEELTSPVETRPEFKEEDYPNGNIAEVLHLDVPEEEWSEEMKGTPFQKGKYYLPDGLGFDLALNDGLKEGPQAVEVVEANEENLLVEGHDSYTATQFQKGDLVARMGQYGTPISLDTLRGLLLEKREGRPETPADVTITPDDLNNPKP